MKNNPDTSSLTFSDFEKAIAIQYYKHAVEFQDDYEDGLDEALREGRNNVATEGAEVLIKPGVEGALVFYDLLVSGNECADADDPVFVPMGDLSDDEITSLPRKAFTDEEFKGLGSELRSKVYTNDEESSSRITRLFEELRKQWGWHQEQIRSEDNAEESLYALGNVLESMTDQELIESVTDHSLVTFFENVIERAGKLNNEQAVKIESSIATALQDVDNYMFRVDDYDESYDFGHLVHPIPAGHEFDLDYVLPAYIYEDEIKEATDRLEEYDGDTYGLLNVGTLFLMKDDAYKQISVRVDPSTAVFYKPDVDLIMTGVLNEVIDEVDDDEPFESSDIRSESDRTLYTFNDGAYILELRPEDLPNESKELGHCVGDEDHKFGIKIKLGLVKLYSLRTKGGRSKFTVEVLLKHDETPLKIIQALGKGNRWPGWDLNKIGKGKVKWMEAQKVGKLVELLGIDPEEVDHLEPAYKSMKELKGEASKLTHNPGRGP